MFATSSVHETGGWYRLYIEKVARWRDALADLPEDVAHAVVHGNAERLWRAAAAIAIGGRSAEPATWWE